MSQKHRAEPEEAPEEASESSATAGAVVLTVLGTGAVGGIVAASSTVGVLGLWVVGTGALWWALRRPVSDMGAPPPPPDSDRPSCDECAGHDLVSVTPLEGQKGMLIYKTAPTDRPNHTHIHLARQEADR